MNGDDNHNNECEKHETATHTQGVSFWPVPSCSPVCVCLILHPCYPVSLTLVSLPHRTPGVSKSVHRKLTPLAVCLWLIPSPNFSSVVRSRFFFVACDHHATHRPCRHDTAGKKGNLPLVSVVGLTVLGFSSPDEVVEPKMQPIGGFVSQWCNGRS